MTEELLEIFKRCNVEPTDLLIRQLALYVEHKNQNAIHQWVLDSRDHIKNKIMNIEDAVE